MLAAEELVKFAPIEAVTLPMGVAYLMSDVNNGTDSLNRPPDAALTTLLERGRSSLTDADPLAPGVAVVAVPPRRVRG